MASTGSGSLVLELQNPKSFCLGRESEAEGTSVFSVGGRVVAAVLGRWMQDWPSVWKYVDDVHILKGSHGTYPTTSVRNAQTYILH